MLTVRRATIDDAKLLFDWRSDPGTRLASHDTAALVLNSHLSWLRATLANPTKRLLIAEEDGEPVGTVRVDQEPHGTAALSWTVAPDARGRGVGKRMVSMVADEVATTCVVRAEVKAGNEASVKVAMSAGMRFTRRDGDVLHFVRPHSAAP